MNAETGDSGSLDDPDLQPVIEVWPMLPKPIKAGILAMVNSIADDIAKDGQR